MPVVVLEHDSPALAGNRLGDPTRRKLHVIVPEQPPAGPMPCVWWLAGYAGIGRGMLADDPWQEGLEERVARLTSEKKIGPMLVVLPDAFTALGGCQYLGSPVVGDYETYLYRELRALVESKWNISAHGIAGKSSGGYGALVAAMRRPGQFKALACHSGDMGFELSIFPDLLPLMNAVRDYGGVQKLVAAFQASPKKRDGKWFGPISMLALASVYSPEAGQPLGIRLPFDVSTGLRDEVVLDRWRARDPLSLVEVPAHQEALRGLAHFHLDCGRRDEHGLHWGALRLHQKLDAYGITHAYEEFDDGHRNTSYRLDVSLPRLYAALT